MNLHTKSHRVLFCILITVSIISNSSIKNSLYFDTDLLLGLMIYIHINIAINAYLKQS